MEKYLIVIEKAASNHSAYSPDVPGCIATGRTIEETLVEMKAALEFHFESMLADGDAIPRPRGLPSYQDAQRESEGVSYVLAFVDPVEVIPQATHA